MPRHTDKDSERVAGAIPAGSPAFWPQEDFPQGILDGDFVRYVAATELWERQSSLDFIAEFTDAFGGGGGSYDQDLNTDDSPAFVTVKLSGLTDGRIPYHVNDATGLADGPLKSDVDDAVSKAHASGSDNQDLSGLVEKVTGYSLVADTEIAKIHALHADDVTIKAGGSPLSLATQELSLVNNAGTPGTITAIDIGVLADSDTVVPTSKAVKAYADGKATLAEVKADADISSAISLKHAAVTLAAGATSNILSLSTQELSVKTQNANLVLAGPASGAAAAPTFRALTADDIPSLSGLYLPLSGGTMTGNIVMANGGTIGQAAGPLLTFDDTGNTLQISGAKVGIGKSPTELLHLYSASYGAPVLLIDGNSPTLKLNIERPSGWAVARLMTGAYNTTSGLTAQMCTVGVLADMGTSPDPPTLTYMYFSVNAGGYDDNALRLYADKSAVFYGNVGIGTTTPLDLLTVSLAGTPTAGLWNTNFTHGNEAILRFRHGDGTADGSGDGCVAEIRSYLPGAWDCDLRFYTTNNKTLNTTPTLTLTGNGDVGIGTTTPQVLCHVAGKLACGDSVTSGGATRAFNLISTDACIRVLRVHDEYGPSLEWISRSTAGVVVHVWDMYTVPATGRFSIRDRTSSDLDRLSITSDGYVGIGTTSPAAKLSINGGLHVGGNSDPGDNNLLVDGTGTITGAFGCNSKTAQTAYASGGALAAYGTGSYGLDSAANMSALHALVVKIRAALVANGIMS